MNEHELYIAPDQESTISCRKCNCKWRFNSRIIMLTTISLFLLGLCLLIWGFAQKNTIIILLSIALWSVAKRPWSIIGLLCSRGIIDLTKAKGEQIAFDFQNNCEQSQKD